MSSPNPGASCRRSATALAACVLLPVGASAGILIPREPGGPPLKVRKQLVEISVHDQVARATLDEVYENTTARALEGEYQLPLPDGAAVSDFATWVDGQRVASRIEEKKQAEKTYSAREGRAPPASPAEPERRAHLQDAGGRHPRRRHQARRGVVGGILPYDGGLVTLRVPLSKTDDPIGLLRIRVECQDQKRVAEVKLVSRQAAQIERSATGFVLTLEAKDARPDDALVVTYRTESSRLGLSFVPFRPEGEESGYFLLLASPQEVTAAQDIVHKDVVFVFDTSGSMGQMEKIQQAREALKRCLSNLGAEDRFSVSRVQRLARSAAQATSSTPRPRTSRRP